MVYAMNLQIYARSNISYVAQYGFNNIKSDCHYRCLWTQ